jgi:hypothetical protein
MKTEISIWEGFSEGQAQIICETIAKIANLPIILSREKKGSKFIVKISAEFFIDTSNWDLGDKNTAIALNLDNDYTL